MIPINRLASPRVNASDRRLIVGAAVMTIGTISIHAAAQDQSHWARKRSSPAKGALAMPLAISVVRPDCRTAKT